MLNLCNKNNVMRYLFLFIALMVFSAKAQPDSQPVISDFLNVYNYTTGKFIQLAEAIPDDKYDWRPAEAVRSVREVVLHATSGNYFFGSFFGAIAPQGVDAMALEKSAMSKEEAIAAFKASLAVIQEAAKKLTAEQLNEMADFFGNKITKRQTILALGDHAAEHLGQLIAYGRMNNVTPPWSKKSN